jgi:hypothetical protein
LTKVFAPPVLFKNTPAMKHIHPVLDESPPSRIFVQPVLFKNAPAMK